MEQQDSTLSVKFFPGKTKIIHLLSRYYCPTAKKIVPKYYGCFSSKRRECDLNKYKGCYCSPVPILTKCIIRLKTPQVLKKLSENIYGNDHEAYLLINEDLFNIRSRYDVELFLDYFVKGSLHGFSDQEITLLLKTIKNKEALYKDKISLRSIYKEEEVLKLSENGLLKILTSDCLRSIKRDITKNIKITSIIQNELESRLEQSIIEEVNYIRGYIKSSINRLKNDCDISTSELNKQLIDKLIEVGE